MRCDSTLQLHTFTMDLLAWDALGLVSSIETNPPTLGQR